MATNIDPTSPEAIEALRNVLNELGNFSDRVRQYGGIITEVNRSTRGQSEREWNERVAMYRKVSDATVGFTNELTGLASQIQGAAGGFSSLTGVVNILSKKVNFVADILGIFSPVLGNVVKVLNSAGSILATEVIKNFEKAYGVFLQLSDVGAVDNFDNLSKSMDKTGMNFSDTGKLLGKFSKDLAYISGSAVSGREKFDDLANTLYESRREFQKLGITTEQFNDYTLTYLTRRQMWGMREIKDAKELSDSTEKYIKELDVLAKLTGLSRKEAQSKYDAYMAETRFSAALYGLPDDIQDVARQLALVVETKMSPTISQGIRDMFSGVPTTAAARQVYLQFGGIAQEIVSGVKTGRIKEVSEAFNQLLKPLPETVKNIQGLSQFSDDSNLMLREFAALVKAMNAGPMSKEEAAKLREKQKQNLKETNTQNARLANASQALYDAGTNLEKLAISSDTATWAMESLAEGIDEFTKDLYKYMGKKPEPEVQARWDLTAAKKEVRAAKKEVATIETEGAGPTLYPGGPRLPTTDFVKKSKLKDAESRVKTAEEKLIEAQKRVDELNEQKYKERKKQSGKQDEAKPTKPEAPISSDKKEFLSTLEKDLVEAAKKMGVANPEVIAKLGAAQAAHESKWGASTVGQAKNYFGVKADKSWAGPSVEAWTTEYNKKTGQDERVLAKFRAYESRQESLENYIKFLQENPIYEKAGVFKAQTPKEALRSVAEAGYATDARYYEKVSAILKESEDNLKKAEAGTPKMADGGVASGPKAGYNIRAHGDEAFVPLSGGRKIPVEISNFSHAAITDSFSESFKKYQADALNNVNSQATIVNSFIESFKNFQDSLNKNFESKSESVFALKPDSVIPVEIKNTSFPTPGKLDDYQLTDLSTVFEKNIKELKTAYESTNSRLDSLIAEMQTNNTRVRDMHDTLADSKTIQRSLLTRAMS